jgi:hypothetical protein
VTFFVDRCLSREALDSFVRVRLSQRSCQTPKPVLRLALSLRSKRPRRRDGFSNGRARTYSLSQHGTSRPNIHMQHTPNGRSDGFLHVIGDVCVHVQSPASTFEASESDPASATGPEPAWPDPPEPAPPGLPPLPVLDPALPDVAPPEESPEPALPLSPAIPAVPVAEAPALPPCPVDPAAPAEPAEGALSFELSLHPTSAKPPTTTTLNNLEMCISKPSLRRGSCHRSRSLDIQIIKSLL